MGTGEQRQTNVFSKKKEREQAAYEQKIKLQEIEKKKSIKN